MACCVEHGLTTPGQIQQAIKTAGMLGDAAGALRFAGGALSSAGAWALPALLVAPPALGYLGGRLAAKATDVDDFDTDEAKRQELINEYHRQTERTKRQALVRQYAESRQPQSSHMFI
jgi:hypothetical protein